MRWLEYVLGLGTPEIPLFHGFGLGAAGNWVGVAVNNILVLGSANSEALWDTLRLGRLHGYSAVERTVAVILRGAALHGGRGEHRNSQNLTTRQRSWEIGSSCQLETFIRAIVQTPSIRLKSPCNTHLYYSSFRDRATVKASSRGCPAAQNSQRSSTPPQSAQVSKGIFPRNSYIRGTLWSVPAIMRIVVSRGLYL